VRPVFELPQDLSVHEAMAHREAHELSNAVQIQLVHDSSPMPVDGVDAQLQQCCNALVCFSFSDKLQDLPLPYAEHVKGVGCMFMIVLQYDPKRMGGLNGFPLYRAVNGDEILVLSASGKEPWVPVTREEFINIWISVWQKRASGPQDSFTQEIIDRHKAVLAAMPPAERRMQA
jgi:hypothetical protein